MRVGRAFVVGVACLASCASEPPEIAIAMLPATSAAKPWALDTIAWNQTEFAWSSLGILNQGWFNLKLSSARLRDPSDAAAPADDGSDGWSGLLPGKSLLELGESSIEGRDLPIRESATVEVRFAPPLPGEQTLWTTGDYGAIVEFDVATGTIFDNSTGLPDFDAMAQVETQTIQTFVTFSIDCDLDDDGFDDYACAGDDCNDTYAAISPDAVEICDGVDNDCNEGTDEGCPTR
ncbi:MAG: hypothetical protein RLZZ383_2514 [Pseudomonadota bacterium]|jgi:hypothetical protein